ncbi:MAG: glycosyltransferase family 2 protein [Rothia sp. (in: high G+C Gram-positive bacteria)]|nr:glycosyltransferase family 2 protein [Rothia sp. (in: high G+C Gram-positive bacteria)]
MSSTKISALIATAGARPQLLRQTVQSMFDQDYQGHIEVIVVFDYVEVDPLSDLDVPPHRSLKTIVNNHSKGLAGGRNTGIVEASGDYVGFCDDDDYWYPTRISEQIKLWEQNPDAVAISSGITIRSEGKDIERLAPAVATFDDFLLSRIIEINPCTTLFKKTDLLPDGRIGLVDEDLPAAYGEDYDLLLRATKFGDIHSIQQPGALILWDRPSFFAGRWKSMVDGLTYILQKYPEFERQPKGLARIAGQVAFAHAALGNKEAAKAFARSALRRDPKQLRAWAAYTVALGLATPQVLLDLVNKTGRGL